MTSNFDLEEVQLMEVSWAFSYLSIVAFLVYALVIIAAISIPIAIWRGMKAQERMADSMERIEKIIERNQTQR
jgi:hypothetical protein